MSHRFTVIALALAIVLASCAPAPTPVAQHDYGPEITAAIEAAEAELRAEYQGQLGTLQAQNEALKAEIESLKSAQSGSQASVSDLEARLRIERLRQLDTLGWRYYLIADTLNWEVETQTCRETSGLIILNSDDPEYETCITGFSGFALDSSASHFLVLHRVMLFLDGYWVDDFAEFTIAQVGSPSDSVLQASNQRFFNGSEQEEMQRALGWPEFGEVPETGAFREVHQWWPLTEGQAGKLSIMGLVKYAND